MDWVGFVLELVIEVLLESADLGPDLWNPGAISATEVGYWVFLSWFEVVENLVP